MAIKFLNLTGLQRYHTAVKALIDGNTNLINTTATDLEGQISTTQTAMQADIDTNAGSIATIEGDITSLEGSINSINGTLTTQGATIAGHTSAIATNAGDIADILETIGGVEGNVANNRQMLNINNFGAVPNNTGYDNYTAITNAIAQAKAGDIKTIYIPKGIYYVSSTIEIVGSDITIIGEGKSISVICGVGAVSPIVKIGSDSEYSIRTHLKSFAIRRYPNGADITNTIGLHNLYTFHPDTCIYEDLSIHGSWYAVQSGNGSVKPSAVTIWRDCEFGNYDTSDTEYAFYCYDGIEQKFIGCRFMGYNQCGFYNPNNGNPNDWVFSQCYFGSVAYAFGGDRADHCVRISTGFLFTFMECTFEEGYLRNVLIEGGRYISFIGCFFSGAGGTGNAIYALGSSGEIYDLKIKGCQIINFGQTNSASAGTGRGIYIQDSTNGVKSVVIEGNWIKGSNAGACIRVENEQNIIANNHMQVTNDQYCLHTTAGSQKNVITGNVMERTGTSGTMIYNDGSNSVLNSNVAINGTAVTNNGTGNQVANNI